MALTKARLLKHDFPVHGSSRVTLDATSKVLFHCDRQKRDSTNAIKMLHQMLVGVVVVALRLVLITLGAFHS